MSQAISKKGDKKTKSNPVCGKVLATGLKIFGDTWTLFIVNSLSTGEKRFCELQREVGDLNPVTLTSRLKKLQSEGFVDRKMESIDKLSVSYVLTKKGRGMLPVLRKIESFAKQYI
ncbi:MAG: helix-turn-helix domain-containing protein [Candidatus Paceibacterota bacterium]|jgi:DNA-binding HxlR family transcriptional regulator